MQPRIWTRQPQYYARASKAPGLVGLFSGLDLRFDAASDVLGSITGPTPSAITSVIGDTGYRVTDFAATDATAVLLPRSWSFGSTEPWSIMLRARCDSTGTAQMLAGEFNTANSWIRIDRGGNRVIFTNASGTSSVFAGAIDANWHTITLAANGAGTVNCYFDAVARTPVSATSTFVLNSLGYAYNSTTFAFDGQIGWAAVWRRTLSLPEHVAISNNPWQLFAPQPRRIFVGPSAGGGITLVIQDATHGHTADGVSLTQQHQLAVQDANHAHAVDNLALTQQNQLSVADATHGHAADNVTLAAGDTLAIADATHGHAADNIALTQDHVLVVADAFHQHSADNVALLVPSTEPEESHSGHYQQIGYDERLTLNTIAAGYAGFMRLYPHAQR